MTLRLTRRLLVMAASTAPLGQALAQPSLAAMPAVPVTVLTAHPAAYALAAAITNGTSIVVMSASPDRLPASRLASFLSGRGKTTLAEAAAKADAVISFRSFWPDDPLYRHARRTNIRLVEIDAAQPIDGQLPGIAIAEPTDDGAIYDALALTPMTPSGEATAPWLSPTAMGRMADILAADLSRLDPSSAETVAANSANLKRQLLSLKADSDIALAKAVNLTALALSPQFRYLANDLSIELLGSITAAPAEWTAERCARLTIWLKENDVSVVLLDTEPGDGLRTAIHNADGRHVVLATLDAKTGSPLASIAVNLELITQAFAP